MRDYPRNIDVIKQKFTANVEVGFIYLFLKNDLGFTKQNCKMINGYSSRSQLDSSNSFTVAKKLIGL